MNRPLPKLKMTTGQRWLELLIILLSAALIMGTAWSYNGLPDSIPLHFGISGVADRWGDKSEIWLLPAICIAVGLLLRWLNSRPNIYNYSVPVSPANAQQLYESGARLIRLVRLWVVIIFCVGQASVIDAAFRQGNTPVIWLIWVAVGGLFSSTIWGVYRIHVSATK
jgi:uncharacterized membrane protein